MCYDDQDVLHVVCGNSGLFEQARFVFRIKGRDILDRKDFTALDAQYKAWLASHVLPQPFSFDPAIMLPEVTGRRYLAKASAVTAWNNDRQVVGTQDGLLAIVSADNTVFSLGNASAYGPVRCLCTNKAQNKLWGVSGDIDDMGYVFTYDDKHGLRQLGVINYNTHGYYGPTASNVLSSIVLNDQENTLAIGAADRTATVHVIDL